MSRGGARPGAGRPRTGRAMEGVNVHFSEAQLQYINKLAQQDHSNRSAMVRRIVDYVMRYVRKEDL
jgi:metal-responsive CopG/Arc/MetJ family transcriptional regulator